MISFTEAIAVGVPGTATGKSAVESAIRRAIWRRKDNMPHVEAVLGFGYLPSTQAVPLRFLGYLLALLEAVRELRNALRGAPIRLRMFASPPKLAAIGAPLDPAEVDHATVRILAVAAAIVRSAGFDGAVYIEPAAGFAEVPKEVASRVAFSLREQEFLQNAAATNGNGGDPWRYAVEHAAPSMFGDLSASPDLIARIGPRPEAVFWGVCQKVRLAAESIGIQTSAGIAVVARGLKRPAYHPAAGEPVLDDLLRRGAADALRDLDTYATDALRRNMKREARLTQAFINADVEMAHRIAEASGSARRAVGLLDGGEFNFGSRFASMVERMKGVVAR